jgi:prevent-host-death family protein
MRKAGIGEARQNLSGLLQFVAEGHEILITDRGRPVARLVPPLPLSPKAFVDPVAARRKLPVLDPTVSSALGPDVIGGAIAPDSLPAELGPIYLDGSSLAKLYLPEPESDTLGRLLDGRRDLTVADLAVTELITAFRSRLDGVAAAQRSKLSAFLHRSVLDDIDGGKFRRIELSPSAYRAAERVALSMAPSLLLGPHQVLHVALAMTAGVAGVITFDKRLAAAAEALGLRTWPEGT